MDKLDTILRQIKPGLLGLVTIALGLFVLLVAAFMGYISLSGRLDVEQTNRAADETAAEVDAHLDSIQSVLARSEVSRLARQALSGDEEAEDELFDTVRRDVASILRLELYPAEIEQIEPASYPGPDYAVIDMLLDAQQDGVAPAQVHHAGTATENLSFVRPLPGDDGHVGYILLSVPVSVLTSMFSDNQIGNYLALEQVTGSGDPVILKSFGSQPGSVDLRRVNVPGTLLQIAWHHQTNVPLLDNQQILFGVGAGCLLLALGLFVRRRANRMERARPAAEPEPPAKTGEKPGKAANTRKAAPARAREKTPEDPAQRSSSGESAADVLPWLQEAQGAADQDEAGPGARPPAASSKEPLEYDSGDDKPARQRTPTEQIDPAELEAPEADGDEQEDLPDLGGPESTPASMTPVEGLESDEAPAREADSKPAGETAPEAEAPTVPEPAAEAGSEPKAPVQDAPPQPPRVEAGIFRAYDIRGVVGRTLTRATAKLIGQAIGSEARDRGITTIALARDGRLSGAELLAATSEGLRMAGVDVIEVGAVPTPVLYFAAYELAAGSGVMVTGSHNPPDYNGFKIMLAGDTLSGDEIQSLHQRIEADDFNHGDGKLEEQGIVDQYIERISTEIQLERPLKVVVDCGNGIAGAVAPRLLEAIGADVTPLYAEVDGTFPNHHPDPSVSENLEDLKLCVRNFGSDLGVAFDGDGDRLGVMTAEGRIIWPDRLMILFARDLLKRQKGASIIFDVKCSNKLAEEITAAGGQPLMWKTGHSLIKRKMKEEDVPLAGEMSGHFFFAENWLGFDDALYACAKLLEILAADTRSSSEILTELPVNMGTPELKVPMAEGQPHAFIQKFQDNADFEDATINDIDGVRADFEDGWGLVRASNTTPVLVVRFEGTDEAALKRIQDLFRNRMLDVDGNLELPF